jgi:hypothetical protein
MPFKMFNERVEDLRRATQVLILKLSERANQHKAQIEQVNSVGRWDEHINVFPRFPNVNTAFAIRIEACYTQEVLGFRTLVRIQPKAAFQMCKFNESGKLFVNEQGAFTAGGKYWTVWEPRNGLTYTDAELDQLADVAIEVILGLLNVPIGGYEMCNTCQYQLACLDRST